MGVMAVREFISGSDFIFEIDRRDVAIRGELQFICMKGSISVALKTNESLPCRAVALLRLEPIDG